MDFWLSELRSPEFLSEVINRFPDRAAQSPRLAVVDAIAGGDIANALAVEQVEEMSIDRKYWQPLRLELEALRHATRRQ